MRLFLRLCAYRHTIHTPYTQINTNADCAPLCVLTLVIAFLPLFMCACMYPHAHTHTSLNLFCQLLSPKAAQVMEDLKNLISPLRQHGAVRAYSLTCVCLRFSGLCVCALSVCESVSVCLRLFLCLCLYCVLSVCLSFVCGYVLLCVCGLVCICVVCLCGVCVCVYLCVVWCVCLSVSYAPP